MKFILACAACVALCACNGVTGSETISFVAQAAGPADAVEGQAYRFTNAKGFDVTLDRAMVHIGGVYLNRNMPVLGAQETSCILPGVYVAQVTAGMDIDALSPTLQTFPTLAEGTTDQALAAEVWLTGGRVDADDDPTIILDVAGTASRDGVDYPFEGAVSIGKNRKIESTDPATPGANPLCKTRIVSPIPVDIKPTHGGRLVVRVHPDVWFANVDFAQLEASGTPPVYRFLDQPVGQPSINLMNGLRSVQDAYEFLWEK